MDQSDSTAVVLAHVQAFNERDLGALLDGLADDAFWTTGRTTVRGRPELAELFQGAITDIDARLTIRTLLAGADRVAAELTETFTRNGERQPVPIAGFYEIADRKIARARIYREGSAEAG